MWGFESANQQVLCVMWCPTRRARRTERTRRGLAAHRCGIGLGTSPRSPWSRLRGTLGPAGRGALRTSSAAPRWWSGTAESPFTRAVCGSSPGGQFLFGRSVRATAASSTTSSRAVRPQLWLAIARRGLRNAPRGRSTCTSATLLWRLGGPIWSAARSTRPPTSHPPSVLWSGPATLRSRPRQLRQLTSADGSGP
jgi:hypothetical protein